MGSSKDGRDDERQPLLGDGSGSAGASLLRDGQEEKADGFRRGDSQQQRLDPRAAEDSSSSSSNM